MVKMEGGEFPKSLAARDEIRLFARKSRGSLGFNYPGRIRESTQQ